MRAHIPFSICLILGAAACGPAAPGQRTYTLQGQIVSIDASRQQATIKHEEIRGFMPAMTMPYKVKDAQLLGSMQPGDLINAKLVVVSNDAYLATVNKVGTAPLEKTNAESSTAASPAIEPLRPGEAVPNAHFVDQDGKTREFGSFKGSPVVVTFIYTRCPVPDFCPLMDRHFVAIQETAKSDPALRNLRLVSISFDPITDTPPVLKKHAKELNADPARWTFLTGQIDDIDRFAARFGVAITRAKDNPLDITHTLRTAIVDSEGKLVKLYVGNEWTPPQVLADLKTVG
jgi:protein SCO1/2